MTAIVCSEVLHSALWMSEDCDLCLKHAGQWVYVCVCVCVVGCGGVFVGCGVCVCVGRCGCVCVGGCGCLFLWMMYDFIQTSCICCCVWMIAVTKCTQRIIWLWKGSHSLCLGPRGGAVGWGTVLEVIRLRGRFPMVSLEIFIDIILLAALWPWGWLSL